MRLLAPILHLLGPGTSKELLVVRDERVGLEPSPAPHCTPEATHPVRGQEDNSDHAAVMLTNEGSCSESGSSPFVLLEED